MQLKHSIERRTTEVLVDASDGAEDMQLSYGKATFRPNRVVVHHTRILKVDFPVSWKPWQLASVSASGHRVLKSGELSELIVLRNDYSGGGWDRARIPEWLLRVAESVRPSDDD